MIRRETVIVGLVLTIVTSACTSSESEPEQSPVPSTLDTVAATAVGSGEPSQPEGQTTSTRQGIQIAPPGGLVCWTSDRQSGADGIALVEVTEAYGLIGPLTGMYGHAAGWGDLNGDLVPDLVFGTFADKPLEKYQVRGATEPKPDTLFLGGAPLTATQDLEGAFGRTSGIAMVDLDNDTDLDLVMSRNVKDKERGDLGSAVYRNDGGTLTLVESGIDPELSGRSIGVLDYDRDGLVDLLILEDRYEGGNSRLYRNLGGLEFEDTTTRAGLPNGIAGLGIATGDVDADGTTDVFVAGSNRLFLGTGSGFVEVVLPVLEWQPIGDEDDVAGAAFADVDLDGRLDLVVGQHYNSTVAPRDEVVPVRLYLNRTQTVGQPQFEDVTEAAGLTPLPTKAPHVEFADFDNDGVLDILTSASAGDGSGPAIFRGTGIVDGIPRFETPTGLGSDQYWTTAPTVDINRDGRLDLLAVEWFSTSPSLLFLNESASGNWLSVSVGEGYDSGVGTSIRIYEPGMAGDPAALLGYREITATLGYTAGTELIAHFGLGELTSADVVITGQDGTSITLSEVAANAHIRYPNGCG